MYFVVKRRKEILTLFKPSLITKKLLRELKRITILAEKYEDRHYPINPPNPVEVINFRMDQIGLNQKDLVP
jgi:antitoxin component HigA of HigAB toxin-antitoxin module